MDEIRLAFDTVIVGLFALPWFLILLHVVFCLVLRLWKFDILSGIYRHSLTKDWQLSTTVLGAILIALSYVIGSFLTVPADWLFENRYTTWLSDDHVKVDVYLNRYLPQQGTHSLNTSDFPNYLKEEVQGLSKYLENDQLEVVRAGNVITDDAVLDAIRDISHHQRFYNFTHNQFGHENLKRLYSQIIVLRGTALNALITVVICIFAIPLELWKESPKKKRNEDALRRWVVVKKREERWIFAGLRQRPPEGRQMASSITLSPSNEASLNLTSRVLLRPNPAARPLWRSPRVLVSWLRKKVGVPTIKRYLVIKAVAICLFFIGTIGWYTIEREYDYYIIGIYHGQQWPPSQQRQPTP